MHGLVWERGEMLYACVQPTAKSTATPDMGPINLTLIWLYTKKITATIHGYTYEWVPLKHTSQSMWTVDG